MARRDPKPFVLVVSRLLFAFWMITIVESFAANINNANTKSNNDQQQLQIAFVTGNAMKVKDIFSLSL